MKISIIIPTIGRVTLKTVLEAILESDNFEKINPEILVVFDGKITEELLLPVSDNIKLYETGEKVYSGGVRNLGLEYASGDIIVFIGDDTIPKSDWLKKVCHFHEELPDVNTALLGKISWISALREDPFHKFLENGPQFRYDKILKIGADWHHFYTSNISLKREFIEKERFSSDFSGWGFEDIEFGYRLYKKGLLIFCDPECEVYHNDPQTLEKVITRTINARKNVQIFEKLHPELHIYPSKLKSIFCKFLCFGLSFLPKEKFPKCFWWSEWKRAWLGMETKTKIEKN